MNSISARMREPSTWAGLAALIGMGAQAWATKDPTAIGSCVAGLAAIFMPEKGAVK